MNSFVCIKCPVGCNLVIDNNQVSGARCPKGIEFAKLEQVVKLRSFTTTMKTNIKNVFVPVKASKYIPLKEFKKVLKMLNNLTIILPVNKGDIIYKNILEDINIIATRSIKEDYNEYYK